MTVKELIKELEKVDQDLPVCILDYITHVGLRILDVTKISIDDSNDWKYKTYSAVDGQFVRLHDGS